MYKNMSKPDDAGQADQVDPDQIRPSINAGRTSTSAIVEEANNFDTEANTARNLLEDRGDP